MTYEAVNLETRSQGDVHNTFHPLEPFSSDDTIMRWRPKITVYRLLVLLTTIALGIGKAITSGQGAAVVSVRIEWASGVVVFVILYVVGLYDEDHLQQRMKWLFHKELAENRWSVSYRTDEVGLTPGFHLSRHPPITVYRIAITASVLLFGAAKATLGYLGHSRAANYVDGAFAVIVTPALYCIGLYENNPLGLFPTFFATDYGPSVRAVLASLIGLILFLTIISMSVWGLINQFESFPAPDADLSFLDFAYYVSVKLGIVGPLLVAPSLGVFALSSILWEIASRVLNIRESEGLPTPVQQYYGRRKTTSFIITMSATVSGGALFIISLYWIIWLLAGLHAEYGWWWALPFYLNFVPYVITSAAMCFLLAFLYTKICGNFFGVIYVLMLYT